MEKADFLKCAPLNTARLLSLPVNVEESLKQETAYYLGEGQAVVVAGGRGKAAVFRRVAIYQPPVLCCVQRTRHLADLI